MFSLETYISPKKEGNCLWSGGMGTHAICLTLQGILIDLRMGKRKNCDPLCWWILWKERFDYGEQLRRLNQGQSFKSLIGKLELSPEENPIAMCCLHASLGWDFQS